MARVGGRNSWIAVPASLLCGAVVAALVWLSLPMMPVAVAWAGDTLRAASQNPFAPPADATAPAPAAEAADCRDLYPNALWTQLAWRGGALLDQDGSLPPTAAASVVDALAPTVRLSCAWTFDGGGITTTLASVPEDAAATAGPAFASQGFACTTAGALLTCTRTDAGVREEHTIGAGLWLSNVSTGWRPDGLAARLAADIW